MGIARQLRPRKEKFSQGKKEPFTELYLDNFDQPCSKKVIVSYFAKEIIAITSDIATTSSGILIRFIKLARWCTTAIRFIVTYPSEKKEKKLCELD